MRIDLNSDLGESFGPWPMGQDAALMDSISSANVACGFHAGDPGAMRATIALAREKGVAIGAHPGFQDLVGFGRREMKATPAEVEDLVLYQVSALAGMAAAQGVRLQHVKAHGALYNMACRDRALADAIAKAVAAFDRSLILFGLPNSELLRAGEAAGLPVAAEVFADRAYDPDGSLTSRAKPGSVIHDTQTGRRARHQDGARSESDRRRRLDDRAAGRHDLPARRYAGRRRSCASGQGGTGSGRESTRRANVERRRTPSNLK